VPRKERPTASPETTPGIYALTAVEDELRAALDRLIQLHGRGLCREPQRLEAMMRDLCPGRRREVFLLVSAVKEQIVSEMLVSVDVIPDDLVVARGSRRLQDSLGLSEDSARWAVALWLPASRVLATMPDTPLKLELAPQAASVEDLAPQGEAPVFDWRWLGLCVAALGCTAAGLATVTWFALHHTANTLRDWTIETGLLAVGLGVAAGGLTAVSSALRRSIAPNHRGLGRNRAAAAMLLDIAVLLALPMFVVGAPAVWVAEWVFELHLEGQPHDLPFQLGRILQSLAIAAALVVWVRASIGIQGKIASSLIRLR
jgi:hypothetical protein